MGRVSTVLIGIWGAYAMLNTPVEAIPDLSDVQVIILTEYPGQAPQVVEDQVTYPLTTAMLSVPFSKVVRGYSFFGLSFVYTVAEINGGESFFEKSEGGNSVFGFSVLAGWGEEDGGDGSRVCDLCAIC